MKQVLFFAVFGSVVALFSSLSADDTGTMAPSTQASPTTPMQPMTPAQPMAPTGPSAPMTTPAPEMPMVTADCSSFTPGEQQFSSQLTPDSKDLFCGKFSEENRATAMEMAGQPDANGNVMTADQAVQKVASDNNMLPPAQPRRHSGGCPVKQ